MTNPPLPFEVPAQDQAASLWARVNADERIAVEQHLTGRPVNVGAVAHSLGLVVLSGALPSNISGQIRLRPSDNIYEIKVNFADAAVRQRFTVAHEIAHFLLHRNEIDGDGITDTILYRSSLSDKKEAEANKLAAFILLPWNPVQAWSEANHGQPIGENLLSSIANAWKVSDLTVGYRFGF